MTGMLNVEIHDSQEGETKPQKTERHCRTELYLSAKCSRKDPVWILMNRQK